MIQVDTYLWLWILDKEEKVRHLIAYGPANPRFYACGGGGGGPLGGQQVATDK